MNILFLTVCNYPDGDANAVRQNAFAKILHEFGHKITVLSLNQSENSNDFQTYEGISYKSIKGRYFECKSQLATYFANEIKPDLIFLNTIPLPAFIYAKEYAVKNNIRLFHDAVEWHSINQYSIFDLHGLICGWYRNWIINTIVLDEKFKVIAISNYLYSYFKNKYIDTIKIPVIMDMSKIEYSIGIRKSREILSVTYAGSPKSKDYLDKIILGINMLSDDERNRIEFNIFGITEEELADISGKTVIQLKRSGCVIAHGKVSREVVLEKLKETDFTILIRHSKARYAKAGFPTKVVESLATGTPVILNLTSDLAEYLNDGYDSLVVASESPEDIVCTLRRALNLPLDELVRMRLYARKTAEDNFDLCNYFNCIRDFSAE